MNESGSGKPDVEGLKARIKGAFDSAEGTLDADTVVARLRDAIGNAVSEVDANALMARARSVVDQAGGAMDTETLKHWAHEVDSEKVRGWLEEAKAKSAGAAAMVGEHGERLAEKAPGALDKALGTAKDKLGELTGNEDLTRSGELDQLRGEIKERYAAAEPASDVAETAKKPREGG